MADQGFARRMMAQRLMTEKRDDPFSDSRFFVGKMRPSLDDMENPTRFSDMAMPAYSTAATGSLFAPGAGVTDLMGYAPNPAQPGEFLPSFGENISAGNYLDAGLQTLGGAGDVMMAGGAIIPPLVGVGAALKAPRAARVAGKAGDVAADVAKVDPNQQMGDALAQAQARYFEAGKFEPPTAENPISVVLPTETEPGIIAFHGSGADFDEFRLEMIGTGEGAQAYGYGLYFTDSEDIAKFYRNAMVDRERGLGNVRIKYKGKPFAEFEDSAAAEADPIKYRMLAELGRQIELPVPTRLMDDPEKVAQVAKDELLQSIDRNIEMQRKAFANESASVQATMEDTLLADIIAERDALARIDPADIEVDAPTGKIYKVALSPKPDELLDYDLPLSQQPEILEKLQSLTEIQTMNERGMSYQNMTGKDLYRLLEGAKPYGPDGNPRAVSEQLAKAGIPGIKYRASGSRGAGVTDEAAERNYVIFDDSMIKILEKYGIIGPVLVTGGAVAATQRGGDEEGSIFPDA